MDISLRVFASLGAALALFLALAASTLGSLRASRRADAQLRQTFAVRLVLEQAEADGPDFRRSLDRIQTLVSSDPAQRSRLERLRQARDSRQARAVAEQMLDAETRVLEDLEDEAARLNRQTSDLAEAALGLALVLLAASYWLVYRRMREESRLHESLRRHADEIDDLYNNAACGYHSLGPDGTYLRVNDTELRWFGYRRDELVHRRRFQDLLTKESAAGFEKTFEAFKRSGSVTDIPYDVRRRDGTSMAVRISATALFDAQGRYVMSRSTLTDDTERRRVEKLKSEIVAMASHELRTPLAGILTAFEVALSAGELDPKRTRILEIGLANARHLLAVVNAYLDATAIEQGRTAFYARDIDLKTVLEEAVRGLEGVAERFGASLTLIARTGAAPVHADPARLREVLDNLVGNAAKFSPRGAPITVRLHRRPGAWRVSVRDRGPGIRPEFRSRIFEKFASDPEVDSRKRGAGMGLSLCRAIIEQMGGRVGFRTVPKQGTLFFFELPAPGAPEPGAASAPRPERAEAGRRTLLLCDDDEGTLRTLSSLAEGRYRVLQARSGRKALELVTSERPDYLLLDVTMPGLDGLETLAEARRLAPSMSVVMLSAVADIDKVRRALELGARAYVTKPIECSPEALETILEPPLRATGS